MEFTEKTLTQEYKFKGKIMSARVDDVELPNGRTAYREVCEHVGGVGILPIDAQGNVVLVRQFRYPYGEVIYEIPAGKMDHGPEDAEACGVRELREETGFTAGRMVPLGEIYPSPGFLTEVVYLYAALDLVPGPSQPDEDEFVEHVTMPFAELEKRIMDNEIKDGKTVVAAYRARLKGLIG
ncbi:NUDIX hydrolase [Intestinibacillus sp. Marseille-P6563]|mgnify:FL=1|uniref:NUDIX hydrolase n=1 Tax=Intestinibacillus sp. Marseille-P6563 TaxID=2364792 RepID=UPI000F046FE0|nr:NUDIX hydrolase [Intestinibacillus sp. Marseille-P6563]